MTTMQARYRNAGAAHFRAHAFSRMPLRLRIDKLPIDARPEFLHGLRAEAVAQSIVDNEEQAFEMVSEALMRAA